MARYASFDLAQVRDCLTLALVVANTERDEALARVKELKSVLAELVDIVDDYEKSSFTTQPARIALMDTSDAQVMARHRVEQDKPIAATFITGAFAATKDADGMVHLHGVIGTDGVVMPSGFMSGTEQSVTGTTKS